MDKKKFLTLKSKWYKKLADNGFDDIEKKGTLPDIDPRYAKFKDHDAVRKYYSLACRWLHDGIFDTPDEKIIWEHHCHGLSFREIGTLMETGKDVIARTVQKHLQRSKMRQNP